MNNDQAKDIKLIDTESNRKIQSKKQREMRKINGQEAWLRVKIKHVKHALHHDDD